ncbi:hypothetical protein BDP27DRAFT_1232061 [Rhodocollybia butyracea]|uniref:Uncharacterized protein n=1 Tax=Rhodocollybia butyracea TaxID=206335 RepID=A0A9P5U2G4_9AGAR|nr:hypothetical protein BDP27DRAFT_1232061 [Rhodocollybia butyracea]
MEWLYQSLRLPEALLHHQQGDYGTIGAGYGFGGGRVRPGEYCNSKHNSKILQIVLDSPVIQCIAQYVDQGLLALFPKLHALYTNLGEKIVNADGRIKPSFERCCYPACHFNLHEAGALTHSNYWNWLFSMCSIFSGGPFDHRRGAHLIAWSLGLAVEFPSGSAVFLPSAAVPHANTSAAPLEHRHSLAFFLPAGLVCYYHNGYRSDKDFRELASPQQLKAWLDYRKDMWKQGLELLQY